MNVSCSLVQCVQCVQQEHIRCSTTYLIPCVASWALSKGQGTPQLFGMSKCSNHAGFPHHQYSLLLRFVELNAATKYWQGVTCAPLTRLE
jgi:hypothetical protein